MPSFTTEQTYWLRIDIMALVCEEHRTRLSDPALADIIKANERALALAEATFGQHDPTDWS